MREVGIDGGKYDWERKDVDCRMMWGTGKVFVGGGGGPPASAISLTDRRVQSTGGHNTELFYTL